jgi:hypothetical protein
MFLLGQILAFFDLKIYDFNMNKRVFCERNGANLPNLGGGFVLPLGD